MTNYHSHKLFKRDNKTEKFIVWFKLLKGNEKKLHREDQ